MKFKVGGYTEHNLKRLRNQTLERATLSEAKTEVANWTRVVAGGIKTHWFIIGVEP